MTHAAPFDPIATAQRARAARGRYPDAHDLPQFGPGGLVQAATVTLESVIEAWLVGEAGDLATELKRGLDWAETAIAEDLAYGDDAPLFSVGLRRARAVGIWLRDGSLDRAAWRATAEASEALWRRERAQRPLLCPLDDVLIDLALAGDVGAAEALGRTAEADPASRAILAILAATNAAERARCVQQFLSQWLPQWLGYLPQPGIAAVLAFCFAEPPWALPPAAVAPLIYALLPDLKAPPAFAGSDAARVALRPGADAKRALQRLDLLLVALGLTRDPDAKAEPPVAHFASWTRHPTLDCEVDWHGDDADALWVEIRGANATALAASLAELLGGTVAPEPEDAVAELLTAPPTIRSAANGRVRWEILTQALTASPPADRATLLPLVAAGLADTDWRVRMAALWGVGALAAERFAGAAARVLLPHAGEAGLNGDDRRTLLGLREAAARKAGFVVAGSGAKAGPDEERRAAFVGRIGALLGQFPIAPEDRHALLIAALLRQPGLDDAMIPRGWKDWL